MTSLAPIALDEVLPTRSWTGTGPRIAVLVPLNFPDQTAETRDLVVRFTRTALDCLAGLGAQLQVIDISRDDAPGLGPDVTGVLLLGGGDVDPALYGHHGDVPNLYGVDRGCDDRTLDAIGAALVNRIPVLGVCRGAQLLNVYFGGTLLPDLGPDSPHHGHGDDPLFLDDTVLIEPGTRLRAVVGRSELTVRNGHHQAVGEVAPQLRVAACGLDGVIEGVEHRDAATWMVGVQWHPEDSDGPADTRLALFRALITEASALDGAVYPVS
jgi:putative glutamine amidotransferase